MMLSEKNQFRIKSSSVTSQGEYKAEIACDLNAVKVIENLKIKIGKSICYQFFAEKHFTHFQQFRCFTAWSGHFWCFYEI